MIKQCMTRGSRPRGSANTLTGFQSWGQLSLEVIALEPQFHICEMGIIMVLTY